MNEEIKVPILFTDEGLEKVATNVIKLNTEVKKVGEESVKSMKKLKEGADDANTSIGKSILQSQTFKDLVRSITPVFKDLASSIDGINIGALSKELAGFGLSSEQVISIGNQLIGVFKGTLSPIGLVVEVITLLADTFKDDLIPIANKVVGAINGIIDPIGSANAAFNKQFDLITSIDTEIPSLVKTYNDLSNKQGKSAEEQEKLNDATQRIAELIPSAVEGIDKYSGALIINVSKIEAFTAAQKESLKVLAISTLELNQQDLKRIESQKAVQDEILKTGLIRKSVLVPSTTSLGGRLETQSFKLTEEENRKAIATAQELNTKYNELQESIKKQQDTIDKINGKKSFAIKENLEDLDKQAAQEDEINKKREQAAKERKDKIDKLTKEFDDAYKKIVEQSQQANVKLADNNEQQVIKLQDIEDRKINDLQKSIQAQAKALGKEVDLTDEFHNIRLASELKFAVDLRKARARDLETAFGIGATVTELPTKKRVIDTAGAFQVDENKTLADAIINPKAFEEKFKQSQKITKEGVDKLNEEIRQLIPKVSATIEDLSSPLDKLRDKLKDIFNLDDNQLDAAISQFQKLGAASLNFYKGEREKAAQAQDAIAKQYDKRIELQTKALDLELSRQKDGSANNVEAAKEELNKLQTLRSEAQVKATQEREKAQKAQLIADGIAQVSNLITAGSEIIKGFAKIPIVGILLGVAAVTTMLLSFSSLKSKAQGSVPKLRQGRKGFQSMGETHENGGDLVEIERSEFVVGTAESQQHAPFLNKLIDGKYNGIDIEKTLNMANAVSDMTRSTRESLAISDRIHNERMQLAFNAAIEKQTEQLIRHDKTKPQYVAKEGGYLEIKENVTGGKSIQKVSL